MLRLGIRLLLIPIFITSIIASFGFTNEVKSKRESYILFDACFNSLVKQDENSMQLSARLNNSANVSQNDFKIPLDQFEIPDTTDEAKSILQDTSKISDTTKVADSVKVVLSRRDSLIYKAKQDSIKRIDSLAADSTARLKYFRASRDDYYVTQFRPKKKSAFFVRPSEGVKSRQVQLDSTGTKVQIKEIIAGQPDKIILEMPLDEYINLRLGAITRDSWESLGYAYELKSDKKDLSQLITDITNIQIPLPASPLLSIFGKPGINLRISGAVDIHGAWRNETTTGITTSALGNTRNEPDFKQQVQINLSGTIGDKLNITADWNTERQFQYENQLKIKYTGYEDEIVQSVEAGNVSLQTSPLVGGSEALFGVKAQFKMGPLSLTALASQKKSEVQEVSVSGGSKSQKYEIHAYDYSQNHYFIDEMYANTSTNTNYFYRYFSKPVPEVVEQVRVKEIEVWKTITGLYNPNERKANAFIDLPYKIGRNPYNESYRDSTQQSVPGKSEIDRRWIKLEEGLDYDVHEETGFISFRMQIQEQEAIAVAFRIRGGDPSGDAYFGEFIKDLDTSATTRLVLKLVKPQNLQPQFKDAWKLQLRNIYPVGGRQLKEEGFTLDIKYIVEGGEPQSDYAGQKLIQAFGLDKTDKSGTSTQPDGAFDFFPNRTIIPSTGEIIFPVLKPFSDDFPANLPEELIYKAIYDTTVNAAKQVKTQDKFILTGEYSASVSSVYSIGFNVVEKSVKVYLNGNLLREGSDYSVDYNIGQIIIRKDDALVPGADLRITYEQNDLFQLASKTLLGLRGEYTINRDTKLGFSFLNLNQQTLSDKVRIGEEPMNNTIYGLDFKTTLDLPFITRGLDQIISTSTPSKLTLNAEYAYISPDPNTKKSTISSDNGSSIAYIDDFEGAKRIIPLGMSYGSWRDISLPKNIPFIGNLPKMEQMNYKAKTYWFNFTPSDITVQDIYGNRKSVSRDDNQITVLDFVFNPNQRGFYSPGLIPNQKSSYWGGFMKPLSSTANNLIEENIEFIEFWVRIDQADPGTKINIDLGQISEDVIPNGKLDTEDKNSNDLLDDGEDTGIDGITDLQEGATSDNPDPNNDNFGFSTGAYERVNGTEGNKANSEAGGQLPDTEDLNRNFTLDNVDSYFRYEVPLDTTNSGGKYENKFIQGVGAKGWYLFRIPLKDTVGVVGSPSLSVVETIRFWVNGTQNPIHLRFAELNLVGNQWLKILYPPRVTLDDTVLTVSTINFEDNPNYHLPPGVSREKDRTQTEYEVFKNEQSLDLIIKELQDGDKREIVKYLYQPLDVFNYKEMKMYIHADDDYIFPSSVSYYQDADNYSSEIYLRFGSDTLNYYEYRQPLQASLDPGQRNWNEISLKFSELTAIKQERDSTAIKNVYVVPVPDMPGHSYAVRGNPTLTRVSLFVIGIVNPSDKGTAGQAVSGSVWVNELRVLGADDTPGWAYSASGSLNFADLLTINANASQTNPYFHKLADRFGSREDRLNWSVSVDLDVLKLIPANLAGSNLRVSYSRTENSVNPLYVPGTDIKIEDSQELKRKSLTEAGLDPQFIENEVSSIKQKAQTANVSETWNVSNVKFKVPTEIWYIRDLINNITLGFNYNKTTGRSPTIVTQNNWVWNASINYALTTSRDLFFKPLDIPYFGDIVGIFSDYKDVKVYFLPQSFNASIQTSRRRSFTQNRSTQNQSLAIKPNIQRDFTASRGAGFNWAITEGGMLNLTLNYSFDIQSTLAYLLTMPRISETEDAIERGESEIWKDIFSGAGFGKDYNYKQNLDFRLNPKLPSIWDIGKFVNVNASYSVAYTWQNNFQQDTLGRSAGYSNRISTGINVKLKSMFAPLFKEETTVAARPQPTQPTGGRTGGRRSQPRAGQQQPQNQNENISKPISDSVAVKDTMIADVLEDSLNIEEKPGALSVSLEYIKLGIKYILLDYDQISINFSQNTSYAGGGLIGAGSGFNNFWGWNQSPSKGPSRLFMLGLSNDLGRRAPNGNLSDNFTQKNDIDFKTSRPLWEGAQLDLTWKAGWGLNKTTTFTTDAEGNIEITNLTSTGTIDRSFLTLPPTLMFSFLGNGIKKVSELYDKNAPNKAGNLSNAFLEGFETFSFISKIPLLSQVMKYIPRPNWSINWSGIEKYPIFSFAKRITLQHVYSSSYSEGWKITPEGDKQVQQQRIDYGFSPLAGVSVQVDNFLGGNLTSNLRYSTRSSYSLGVSTTNITEAFSRDINVSASYTLAGFEFPFFGINLKNDLEFSLSYTSGKTSSVIYEMDNFKEEGKPQEGKTNTTIEPKIKYVMSSRVTLSIFYRRTTIEPEGASRIPPTTTNEAGIDVHIAIQ